jgi:hypothetical protein
MFLRSVADDAASGPAERPMLKGVRRTFADPTVAATCVYAALCLVAATAAYFAIFSQFAPYDDEGTLLVTLKAFTHGDVLYRTIYSEYGPFYYELFGGLFSLTGQAVTTDASRTIVIFVWVASSLLFGLTSHRLTRSLPLGVVGMASAFATLFVLIGEPMHPQGLCVLLIAAFLLLAVAQPDRRLAWGGGAAGALLAALVLTKVNLGAFAVAAVVLAAFWTVGSLYRIRWLRWLVTAGFLLLPVAIMARDLNEGWVRELMLVEILGFLALVVAIQPLRYAEEDEDRALGRWLLWSVVGFAVAFAAILIAIFFTGPTPAEVYDGVVTQAIRVRDVLVTPLPFPPSTLDWGVAAVAAATLSVRLPAGEGERQALWSGILRLGAGVVILLSVARLAPIAINPSAGNPDVIPLVLAWVAAVPPAGRRESPRRRFLRVLLPALAVAQTLQVYPVAGSQMGIAAVSSVPVGALCIADGFASLRIWAESRGTLALRRLGVVATVLTIGLAADFVLQTMLKPAANGAVTYHDQEPLPFPGATALRLPPEQVETYAHIIALLHRYHCTTFAGYPNIDSFYLWSGIEAPPPRAPGAWIKAVESDQQQQTVDALRSSPRPCAILSQPRAELWLHGETPPPRPLTEYLLNDFETVAKDGEFELALPKGSAGASAGGQR